MITGIVFATNRAIDAGGNQPLRGFAAQQEMVDAQPAIARPAVSQVAPIRVHRRVGMQRADGVAPALLENARKTRAAFRLKQRILGIGLCRINIAIGRNDVEVAGQHDRHADGKQLRGMGREAIHPGELVFEFRSGLRVAVRRVERRYKHAVHRSLDVARLRVVRIAGQFGAREDGVSPARENGNAVPRFLATPDRAITRFLDRRFGEFTIRSLQLLKAHHIGLGRAQPGEKIGQPLVNVVDVEGGNFHDTRTSPPGLTQRLHADFRSPPHFIVDCRVKPGDNEAM